MNEVCEWKKFIRILLPLVAVVAVLLGESLASGESVEKDNKGSEISGERDGKSIDSIVDRLGKVKAKWKGDMFWTQAAANLAVLESQKSREDMPESLFPATPTTPMTVEENPDDQETTPPPASRSMMKPKSPKRSKKKSPSSSSRSKKGRLKVTKAPKFVPRTTLTADLNSEYYLEYESDHDHDSSSSQTSEAYSNETNSTESVNKIKSDLKSNSTYSTADIVKGLVTTLTTTRTTSRPKSTPTRPLRAKTTGRPRPKPSKPSKRPATKPPRSKITSAPQSQLDRATITADLGQYGQEYYLEYEAEDPPVKNATGGNDTQLQIQFYPKTPVNLLYLLQAMASNAQPIKIRSPVLGEGEIPLRVPVRVNPPDSPFLFSIDMDSFFTRLAISFFYSSAAIMPFIYMVMSSSGIGLGSLTSILPFAVGKKKRRKRRQAMDNNFGEAVIKNLEMIDYGVV